MNIVNKINILTLVSLLGSFHGFSQSFSLTSPDNNTQFIIKAENNSLTYNISYDQKPIIRESSIGIDIKGEIQNDVKITTEKLIKHQEIINWPLGESSEIDNNYRSQIFKISGATNPKYSIEVRVFNRSVAFRYLLNNKESVVIKGEKTNFNFAKLQSIYRYKEESEFRATPIDQLKDSCDLPATFKSENEYILIGEANNNDYTKSVLSNDGNQTLKLVFYKDKTVRADANFITPWRTVSFTNTAIGLHDFADLSFKLTPGVDTVPDWVIPGKIMRANLTDKEVKETIDFAAEHNFQYVLLDAGWYGSEFRSSSDPLTFIPAVNIPELCAYGKTKNIGVILYVNYVGLKQHLANILPLYKKWGVAGMKFGFVDGLTQQGISWLDNAVSESFKYGFVINVHDNYKPSGLSHKYPNWLTQEGIRGNEHGGNAVHDLTLPFTRSLAGPADFTIGFLNGNKALAARYEKLGFNVSKCHQLALSVQIFSPLQTIFWYGKPTDYKNEREIEFFTKVPTVWDESHYLYGDIGKYLTVARRKGASWFLGSTTIEDRYDKIDLSFLKAGVIYKAEIYEDDGMGGVSKKIVEINKKDKINLKIKANNGVAIYITPKT